MGDGPERGAARAGWLAPETRFARPGRPRSELRELYRGAALPAPAGGRGLRDRRRRGPGLRHARSSPLGQGGVLDIVEDGAHGVLYSDEAGTPADLAAAIDKVQRDAVQYREPAQPGGGVLRRALRHRFSDLALQTGRAGGHLRLIRQRHRSDAAALLRRRPARHRSPPSSPPGSCASRSTLVPLTQEHDAGLRPLPPAAAVRRSSLWPVVFYFHGLYQPRRSAQPGRRGAHRSCVAVAAGDRPALRPVIAWYRPAARPGSLEYFTYSRAFLGLVRRRSSCFSSSPAAHAIRAAAAPRCAAAATTCSASWSSAPAASAARSPQKILAHRELGFEVVGFLDDDPGKRARAFSGAPGARHRSTSSSAVLDEQPDRSGVHRPAARGPPEDACRCCDARRASASRSSWCPTSSSTPRCKATLEDLDGTPVINLSPGAARRAGTAWSSAVIDIALVARRAARAAARSSPLVALAIWLEDRGPIFYRQERMGLDGRPFQILKFRSMRVDAEASTGPIWAIAGRSAAHRASARFLRHWSLDELPQLWNVLQRRHVARRPAPRAPDLRARVQAQGAAVHAAPPRQGRHHRLGAGARLARQHLDPQAHRVRPLLHRELVAGARLQDPLDDRRATACATTRIEVDPAAPPPLDPPLRRPANRPLRGGARRGGLCRRVRRRRAGSAGARGGRERAPEHPADHGGHPARRSPVELGVPAHDLAGRRRAGARGRPLRLRLGAVAEDRSVVHLDVHLDLPEGQRQRPPGRSARPPASSACSPRSCSAPATPPARWSPTAR